MAIRGILRGRQSWLLAWQRCQRRRSRRPPEAEPPSSRRHRSATARLPAGAAGNVLPPTATAPAARPAPPLSAEAQAELDQRADPGRESQQCGAGARSSSGPGGNVNAKDAIQDSAFLYAGAEGFNEVLQLTLAAGADVAAPTASAERR